MSYDNGGMSEKDSERMFLEGLKNRIKELEKENQDLRDGDRSLIELQLQDRNVNLQNLNDQLINHSKKLEKEIGTLPD